MENMINFKHSFPGKHKKWSHLFAVFLLLQLLLCIPQSAYSISYYIDGTNGNDFNDGLTSTSAFQTLGKVFRMGDDNPKTEKITYEQTYPSDNPCIVYIMNGTYNLNKTLLISGEYIKIKNFPGHKPVLIADTQDNNVPVAVRIYSWSPVNWNHITIEGLDIQGGYAFALKIDAHTSDVTIMNCRIHGSGQDCIKIVGEEVAYGGNTKNRRTIISNCEIFDSGKRDPSNAEGIDANAISNAKIMGNFIHDITTTGMYFKGNSDNVLVERNFLLNVGTITHTTNALYDTYGGIYFGECMDQPFIPAPPNDFECMNSIARHNIVVNSGGAAFRSMGAKNVRFHNNTIYNSGRGYSKWYDYLASGDLDVIRSCSSSPPIELNEKVFFYNNIVADTNVQGYPANVLYKNSFIHIWGGAWSIGETTNISLISDNNIYYRYDGDYLWTDKTLGINATSLTDWQNTSGQDNNSVVLTIANGIMPILENPALPQNEINNFKPGVAVNGNIGADINYIKSLLNLSAPKIFVLY